MLFCALLNLELLNFVVFNLWRVVKKIMKEDIIEKLLETWGANKDPKYKEYPIPALVSLGYKIGHQWQAVKKREI